MFKSHVIRTPPPTASSLTETDLLTCFRRTASTSIVLCSQPHSTSTVYVCGLVSCHYSIYWTMKLDTRLVENQNFMFSTEPQSWTRQFGEFQMFNCRIVSPCIPLETDSVANAHTLSIEQRNRIKFINRLEIAAGPHSTVHSPYNSLYCFPLLSQYANTEVVIQPKCEWIRK